MGLLLMCYLNWIVCLLCCLVCTVLPRVYCAASCVLCCLGYPLYGDMEINQEWSQHVEQNDLSLFSGLTIM